MTSDTTEAGAELAEYEPQAGTLALRGDQVEWSKVQERALAHIGVDKAPRADQQVFMHVAQRVGLDPFAKQIYMIGRKERGRNGEPDTVKWSIQTGIDGFRLIAERHPQYAGTLDPEWCGEDGVWHEAWVGNKHPTMARVRVLRHDRQHPISLPVRFWEFADAFQDGNLKAQWRSKPAHMIAKVAEAAALRKAFPQELSGLYTDDEMSRSPSAAGPAEPAPRAAPVTADELTGKARAANVVDGEVVDDDTQPEPAAAVEPDPDPDPAVGHAETSSRGKRPAGTGGEAPAAATPSGGSESPRHGPDPEPDTDEQPTEPAAKPVQLRQLGALFGEAEVAETDRHHVTGLLIRAEVTSWSTLTVAQAQTATDELKRLKRSGHSDGLRGAITDLIRADEQERMESELAGDTVDGEVVNEDQAADEPPAGGDDT